MRSGGSGGWRTTSSTAIHDIISSTSPQPPTKSTLTSTSTSIPPASNMAGSPSGPSKSAFGPFPPTKSPAGVLSYSLVEGISTKLPIAIELGIDGDVYPYHITAIRAELTKLKTFATGLQSYCMAIIPDDKEREELGEPPSLKSAWVRDKYFRDTMQLSRFLRFWVKAFPVLSIYIYDFIPINLIGWLFTAVDDQTAYENIIGNRTRLLVSLENFLRSNVPVYLLNYLIHFQIGFLGTGGMFGRVPRGELLNCCEQIIQTCEIIDKSDSMKVLEGEAINNLKDIRWWAAGLEKDPVTGYFLPSQPFYRPDDAKTTSETKWIYTQEEIRNIKERTTNGNGLDKATEKSGNIPPDVRLKVLGVLDSLDLGPQDLIPSDTGIGFPTNNGAAVTTEENKILDDNLIIGMAKRWNKFRSLPMGITRSFPAKDVKNIFRSLGLELDKLISSITTEQGGNKNIKTHNEMDLDWGISHGTNVENSDARGVDLEPDNEADELWTPQVNMQTNSTPNASNRDGIFERKKRPSTGFIDMEDEAPEVEANTRASTPGSDHSIAHSFNKSRSASPCKKRKLDDITRER
ncbi:hypothetical protein TWF788_004334 [Orbilia oligospora]|uniref:Uncharacterized protein n=1 Tax=Orbilia oligospora TaxID=2813651 RepID=A0A7C8Q5D4_ORBOL|nr:hypothetical protein TWF788_004334 [Orbilia oligospora]